MRVLAYLLILVSLSSVVWAEYYIVTDLQAMRQVLDMPVSAWPQETLPTGKVAGLLPPVSTAESWRVLQTLPDKIEKNQNGYKSFFKWYVNNKKALTQTVFRPFMGTPTQKDHAFCDQVTSVLRTLLHRYGVSTRVVTMEFKDGPGAASHTAMEVWLPKEEKWIYLDPFYHVMGTGPFLDVTTGKADVIELPLAENDYMTVEKRKEQFGDLLKNGWYSTIYHMPTVDKWFEYRDPEIYKTSK